MREKIAEFIFGAVNGIGIGYVLYVYFFIGG